MHYNSCRPVVWLEWPAIPRPLAGRKGGCHAKQDCVPCHFHDIDPADHRRVRRVSRLRRMHRLRGVRAPHLRPGRVGKRHGRAGRWEHGLRGRRHRRPGDRRHHRSAIPIPDRIRERRLFVAAARHRGELRLPCDVRSVARRRHLESAGARDRRRDCGCGVSAGRRRGRLVRVCGDLVRWTQGVRRRESVVPRPDRRLRRAGRVQPGLSQG